MKPVESGESTGGITVVFGADHPDGCFKARWLGKEITMPYAMKRDLEPDLAQRILSGSPGALHEIFEPVKDANKSAIFRTIGRVTFLSSLEDSATAIEIASGEIFVEQVPQDLPDRPG